MAVAYRALNQNRKVSGSTHVEDLNCFQASLTQFKFTFVNAKIICSFNNSLLIQGMKTATSVS